MESFEKVNRIRDEYFEWLYNYACKGKANKYISYRKLLMLMHDIDFDFYIRRDLNRAMDGVDLRHRFADVKLSDLTDRRDIMDILDGPCSVLEMILALAIRCEETIMDNPKYGDRTTQWFWTMIKNLGLNRMSDDNFNRTEACKKLYDFIEHRYSPDGKGGLFYIPNCEIDLTNEEIWVQMNLYLNRFA